MKSRAVETGGLRLGCHRDIIDLPYEYFSRRSRRYRPNSSLAMSGKESRVVAACKRTID